MSLIILLIWLVATLFPIIWLLHHRIHDVNFICQQHGVFPRDWGSNRTNGKYHAFLYEFILVHILFLKRKKRRRGKERRKEISKIIQVSGINKKTKVKHNWIFVGCAIIYKQVDECNAWMIRMDVWIVGGSFFWFQHCTALCAYINE